MTALTLADALTRGHGTERTFLCPVHEDSRPSASLNVIKQVWVCYTCGAHGSLTGEDALIEPDYNALKRWFTDKLEETRVYPEAWLNRWDAAGVHPYWRDRVGIDAARHFRLGYDPDAKAGTYPLRTPAGEICGVVRRSLSTGLGSEDSVGALRPKYRYPRGVDVGKLLFNYTPMGRRAVVLVEGALDAIALWNSGVDAFAIYGARLSEVQINLIDRVDPDIIYTCFDNDAAGFSAHCQVERAFKHRLVSRIVWPASWGKDIDEIGLDHRAQILPPDLQRIESSTCRSKSETPNSKMPSSTSSTRRRMRIVRS